jgi:hypothetical protein
MKKATFTYGTCLGSSHSPQPKTVTAVLPSYSLRELVVRRLAAQGWRYFVSFKDVNGFGLMGSERAEWQAGPSSPVHHNR